MPNSSTSPLLLSSLLHFFLQHIQYPWLLSATDFQRERAVNVIFSLLETFRDNMLITVGEVSRDPFFFPVIIRRPKVSTVNYRGGESARVQFFLGTIRKLGVKCISAFSTSPRLRIYTSKHAEQSFY